MERSLKFLGKVSKISWKGLENFSDRSQKFWKGLKNFSERSQKSWKGLENFSERSKKSRKDLKNISDRPNFKSRVPRPLSHGSLRCKPWRLNDGRTIPFPCPVVLRSDPQRGKRFFDVDISTLFRRSITRRRNILTFFWRRIDVEIARWGV